jgi:hypothetical protein
LWREAGVGSLAFRKRKGAQARNSLCKSRTTTQQKNKEFFGSMGNFCIRFDITIGVITNCIDARVNHEILLLGAGLDEESGVATVKTF